VTATINEHRLPTAVAPRHYSLALQPDLESASFTGRVDIDVDVVEPTRRVILNAAELVIEEVTVTVDGASPTVVFSLDEPRERLVLELHHIHRHPQRQAPGVLPKHLHRQRRGPAHHRDHPVRVDQRPPSVPVLG
jgi:aminopeptidase N